MKIESPASKHETRIIYLDLLRVICAFSVVVLHTSGYAWSSLHYSDPAWEYVNFYNGFFRFSVPVFIMISGAFMLSEKKTLEIKTLFSQKIVHLAKLFIVYSSFYAIVTNLIHFDRFNLSLFFKQIILGHYHLWYLYAIIGLYIITPLLRAITKNNYLTKYFLILAFIFEILLGTIGAILKTINIAAFFSKSYLFFIKGFTIYYVSGYYILNNTIHKKKLIYLLGVISTIVTIVGTRWYSRYAMENSDALYSFLSINVFFQSISIFVFFKETISRVAFPTFLEEVIQVASKYSLGVYLIHDFFLILLSQFNMNCLSFNPLFSIPILSLIIFTLSIFTTIILAKLPILKHIFY